MKKRGISIIFNAEVIKIAPSESAVQVDYLCDYLCLYYNALNLFIQFIIIIYKWLSKLNFYAFK